MKTKQFGSTKRVGDVELTTPPMVAMPIGIRAALHQ
jgi:hypothetical protein